ncbi:hypothetical protein HWV62_12296 [Athelia sp. TMB]|nr:hypothetical protein HWV62_12296 [Athelia sp. TMB]
MYILGQQDCQMDQMRYRPAGDVEDLIPPSPGRFNAGRPGHAASYSLAPNPAEWGPIALSMQDKEEDDFLHNPDPTRDLKSDRGGSIITGRGIANLGCIVLIAASIITLFHFMKKPGATSTQGGFNVGGINATGQVPKMPGNFALIDLDTPSEAYTKPSFQDPTVTMELVFSDEFNVDGRTFYPGDDPFWEANDLEWYDPSAATTKGGALRLTLSKVEDISLNHNLSYRSGMGPVACGRAGFGASLEGMWPYSYDSCDVGTLPNQTHPGTATPVAAVTNGDPSHDNMLVSSLYLLNDTKMDDKFAELSPRPTTLCMHMSRSNGDFVGRSSPEIDIFEATVSNGAGAVSQSAQWAPFNAAYTWLNTTANLKIYNSSVTQLNTYIGGAYQQTTSGLSVTNQSCYELSGTGCFSIYGFEYVPGFDNSYITWINNDLPVWTLMGAGMAADPLTEASLIRVAES